MDTDNLKRDFEALESGKHLCCLYKSKKEQFSVLIPFILTGLENNEKCIYIVDENTKKDIIHALKNVVNLEDISNQVELLTKKDAYLKEGYFDPDKMIELLKQNEEKAHQDGYKGLRVTGEMTWIFAELPGVERLIEYEAKLNDFFPNSTCTALCQYNEKRFDPEILLDIIRTHPAIVIYGNLYENPHYVPPDEFFARMKGEVSWKTYERARDDIINRKKMENKAKKGEREKKLILDSITESVVYYGKDKRIQWANKATAEALNMQPEDLVGNVCHEIWHCRESLCDNCPLTKTWESKTYEEGEITTLDGKIWHAKANPVYENGEMIGVVAVGRDITEQKQAEEALKRSEKNFRLFFENEPEYCYMISPDGVILDINKSALKILGYKKEEIVGTPITTIYAPSSHEKARHLFMKWKKKGVLRNEEVTIQTKKGRERNVLLSAAAMRDDNGDILHSISVQRDITEKKQAEEQIKQSLKEKEVLLKEIHHRVKNNMQIISSLLSLQSASIENAKLRTMFREIQNRVKSMALIHEKLYQSEDFASIDFSDCIKILADEAVQSYRTDIVVTVDADTVSLGIDTAIPCGLIINELVSNAAKHAFPDEGGEIVITFHADGTAVELTVADNGVGIPGDIDIKTTESLGLSLVTLLAVDQLSGTLDLDRSKGTAFRITFERWYHGNAKNYGG